MKRTIVPFLLMALTLIFASCLKSEDEATVSYNDTAISSFSLGTLNRYVKTKAKDGVTDSTYKTTVPGGKYLFRIDHLNHKIYNPDSLPYGTDVKKVVVTVSAKNWISRNPVNSACILSVTAMPTTGLMRLR